MNRPDAWAWPWCCLALLLLCNARLPSVGAELLLPEPLTALTSLAGERMLRRGQYVSDAFLLLENFVSQVNGAYCGIATSAMLLNSLGVAQPLQAAGTYLDKPAFAMYDQVNIFNNDTERVKPRSRIQYEGLSLEELSLFLAAHPGVNSTYRQGRGMSLDDFRSLIVSALAQEQTFVAVNFQRRTLKEVGGGHHSPVAAYNKEKDQVLVLDVSRYKYPAWWCPVAHLYDSVLPENPADPADLGRGLVFVWAPPEAAPRLGAAYITPYLDNGAPMLTDEVQVQALPVHLTPLELTAVVAGCFIAGMLLVLLLGGAVVLLGVVHVTAVRRREAKESAGGGPQPQSSCAEGAEMSPLVKHF